MRVVSLVPSITETLLAWGVVPTAVTRFCEHPELPSVGGTKNPELERIVALHPDVVAMDREENRREDAEGLAGAGLRLCVTDVRSVDDVAAALGSLAAAVGVTPGKDAPARPSPGAGRRTRAFVPIWRRPWMTVNKGTYGSSLLDALGVENVFADHVDRYPTVEAEEVRVQRPDVVLAPSEPYRFVPGGRHEDELAAFGPVAYVDGKDLFWWGVRTPGALERLGGQAARW